MFQLTNLTSAGNQTTTAILADGTTVRLRFLYRAAVQRWTVDVEYKDYVNNGMGLATNPNLLRTWRQIIPFGLRVETVDGTDPFMASDLDNSGGQVPRVKVFVLDQTAGNTDVDDAEPAALTP